MDREIAIKMYWCQLEGMIAENKQREIQGDSMAYTGEAFFKLGEQFRALGNAELAATTANTQMAAALFDLVWTTFSSKVSDTDWKLFAQSWEERLNAKDALRHL